MCLTSCQLNLLCAASPPSEINQLCILSEQSEGNASTAAPLMDHHHVVHQVVTLCYDWLLRQVCNTNYMQQHSRAVNWHQSCLTETHSWLMLLTFWCWCKEQTQSHSQQQSELPRGLCLLSVTGQWLLLEIWIRQSAKHFVRKHQSPLWLHRHRRLNPVFMLSDIPRGE